MSKARTWSVRLSVDDLNASFCLLETDQEIAAWVRGLMRGLNAGDCKEGASKEYAEGWEIGRPARERADEIRAERAEVGSVGGSKRVANAQAIASPTASPIGKPTAQPERRTKNEELGTKERRRVFAPPTIEEATAYAKEIGFDRPSAWMDYYTANGWRVGKTKMVDWKAAMRNWNRDSRQKPQQQKPEWVLRKKAELQTKLEQAERQLNRDIADKGAESFSANLSRQAIESIKAEMAAL
ncbi:MAG: hypothetical protein GX465_14790 [Acidobacteria bacterium]|nr:hypothetical protein [Acidobacteriota bacterium]